MRMDKVNQQVKRTVSEVIQREMADPRLQFVTITEVKVSKDLRSARVLYSFLGDQSKLDEIQVMLDRARGKIRHDLGRRIQMRFTPELNFFFDKSIGDAYRLEEVLKEIHDEEDHSDDSEE